MRRVFLISGIAAFGAALIAGAVIAYAVYNLTALVTRHQNRIVHQLSDALSRPVEVGAIKAKVGLGLAIEASGLKIADDPAFSNTPFMTADKASFDVKFLPLLRGKVEVLSLDLAQPNIRILRNAEGTLNVDSIGERPRAAAATPRRSHSHWGLRNLFFGAVQTLSVKAFSMQDGTIYFSDPGLHGVPLQINHVNTEMNGFHTGSPFTVQADCALFSERPNVQFSGKMGPLLRNHVIDIPDFGFDLKFEVGPVTVDNLRTLVAPGLIVPVVLAMPDPVSASGTITGTLRNTIVDASSSLSGYRVLYRAASNTSATPPLTLDVTGKNALHGTLRLLDASPDNDLTATLSQVGLKFEGARLPAISDLNATVRVASRKVTIEPVSFTVGAGRASVKASADSLDPLNAAFTVKADALQLAQIVPGRPPGEFINQLVVSGTAAGALTAPIVKARITSASGLMQRLTFSNLDLTATYADNRVSAQPLSLSVFDGSVLANINAVVATPPPFDASISFRHINIRDLAQWQGVQTHAISGFMTGNVNASGSGSKWREIRPTLRGNGQVLISDGRLEGINIVAIALDKIAAAPVVSQLVNVTFRSSHQGLFSDSNTDLRQASMTFTLTGPRVTTPNLLIQSPEYQITGDGWFDFDKNIDMSGDIKLTLGLSAAIPVVVMGQYPRLLVLPNIPRLAERVAVGVVSAPSNIIRGGVNGLGSVFGGIKSILP